MQPVFLLADSQLLFRTQGGAPLLERLAAALAERTALGEPPAEGPAAAYLGASNGDEPAFFELFRAAMGQLDIGACRHVPANPSADDLAFLERADLVLLAGGDPRRGLEAFRAAGVDSVLLARYYQDAVLIGVSAGAAQLGLRFWSEGVDGAQGEAVDGLRIVPSLVDVHDEPDWQRLRRLLADLPPGVSGLGIPAGGAAVYHPDQELEPLARPLVELQLGEEGLREALLLPGAAPESGGGGEPEPAS
jgi:hypothetical protein